MMPETGSDLGWSEPAPAKINLALHVRQRNPDGYHSLETFFAFTRFGDRLTAQPADDWSLAIAGPMAGNPDLTEDNLVLRAARCFADTTSCQNRFHLTLEKHIPVAAGLGGGSADAAATLRLLNRVTGTNLSLAELEEMAAPLGADVPACVRSQAAIGTGRGDQLTPAPAVSGTPVLLANPKVSVSTPAVFRHWDQTDRGPLADWPNGRNDLEAAAIAIAPEISEVLHWLRQQPGVSLARMSGSGASCFAIFQGAAPKVPAQWWGVATSLL